MYKRHDSHRQKTGLIHIRERCTYDVVNKSKAPAQHKTHGARFAYIRDMTHIYTRHDSYIQETYIYAYAIVHNNMAPAQHKTHEA